jgi:hypothetical protein
LAFVCLKPAILTRLFRDDILCFEAITASTAAFYLFLDMYMPIYWHFSAFCMELTVERMGMFLLSNDQIIGTHGNAALNTD